MLPYLFFTDIIFIPTIYLLFRLKTLHSHLPSFLPPSLPPSLRPFLPYKHHSLISLTHTRTPGDILPGALTPSQVAALSQTLRDEKQIKPPSATCLSPAG